MNKNETQSWEIIIQQIQAEPLRGAYQTVKLITHKGEVECRYYAVPQAKRAAIWVTGVGGGWASPAKGLYPRLCETLTGENIASLRIRYRYPHVLHESVLDVLAGISFLTGNGIERIALTGHSFGGAVVIQAAALAKPVRTVITLATQSYGADAVSQLGPRCSILLLHGSADSVLPESCSTYLYHQAREPKQLIIYKGARHGLDESATEVQRTISEWITSQLAWDLAGETRQ